LRRIAEDLEVYQGSGQPLPTGRGEFDQWMLRRYPQETSRTDAWGTPYTLRAQREEFEVSSPGPDAVPGTEDDIVESRRLAVSPRGR
jgi:hypothetical protein